MEEKKIFIPDLNEEEEEIFLYVVSSKIGSLILFYLRDLYNVDYEIICNCFLYSNMKFFSYRELKLIEKKVKIFYNILCNGFESSMKKYTLKYEELKNIFDEIKTSLENLSKKDCFYNLYKEFEDAKNKK